MNDFMKAVIEDIREDAIGTRSYFFNIPKGMTWSAGTDLHFAHPGFMVSGNPDKALIRHLSIMTIPDEGKIGFTTRVPGSGSIYKKRLEALVPGDEMVMFKPGNRFPLRREGKSIVLISMGVGVAAVRPMIINWLKDNTGIPSVTNLVVNKKDQFLFRKELEAPTVSELVNIFSENRNSFYSNLETLFFNKDCIFYVVGSDIFLEDVIKRLKSNGIQSENIELDKKPEKKAEMLE